ncbi:MAG TPA: hypothetical protein VHC90_00145 [Bryobacteraceae bacterium]|nr:hypothetical protein [Bryobacteraceae bacterium]
MIVVRNSFVAKPGKAGKLATHLKEMAALGGLRNARVLTDLVGNFNTVVMEHEVESVSDFEALITRYGSDPQMREKAGAYLDFWETGKREMFRIV